MKHNIISWLRNAFPFLLTIGLWRLSSPFWNPAGILAFIPVFYYSFVRPVPWFVIFAILICFLIDYNFSTVVFWTAVYCLVYSVNGFQNYIDFTRMDKNGLVGFGAIFGVALLIQTFANLTWINLAKGIWIYIWTVAMYVPITVLIKRIEND